MSPHYVLFSTLLNVFDAQTLRGMAVTVSLLWVGESVAMLPLLGKMNTRHQPFSASARMVGRAVGAAALRFDEM